MHSHAVLPWLLGAQLTIVADYAEYIMAWNVMFTPSWTHGTRISLAHKNSWRTKTCDRLREEQWFMESTLASLLQLAWKTLGALALQ